jgi:hypothetical protein
MAESNITPTLSTTEAGSSESTALQLTYPNGLYHDVFYPVPLYQSSSTTENIADSFYELELNEHFFIT